MTEDERFEMIESQARAYESLPMYDAWPLVGPGRWMTYPDGTIIYTDDKNMLFAKNDKVSMSQGRSEAIQAIVKLHDQGLTATEAFETFRSINAPITTGDLSEIA